LPGPSQAVSVVGAVKLLAMAVVLLALAVGWYASEYHYQNCVEVAKSLAQPSSLEDEVDKVLEGIRADSTLKRKIDGCSRLPW
jgi:site-specific recombinase